MKYLFRSMLVASALTAGAALPAAASDPVNVEGFTHVQTVGSIQEYRYEPNGLRVLVLEDHSTPVVTYMVTYLVGSRFEANGTTGATHLLEHLMFKGTPNMNREKGNNVDQLLERTGAHYNANTWTDRTCYFEELGSEHLEKAIAMEADRMRNLWLRESDRQPEMTVVRNEFERGENNPIQALWKEIFSAAYVAHAYHWSTIGWRSDIENVPIENLRAFYDTYYWPNNAVATVIGDFDPATALGYIKKYYGVYPKSPNPIPEPYTTEPEQTGPRRVVVKRAGQLGVVGIAYKTPDARDPDFPTLTVLDTILGDGKNSRLYRALTDKNLSTGAYAYPLAYHDPSLNFLFVPLAPGVEHETVEKAALAEIEKVKKDGVTQDEVSTAVAKMLADSAYQRDGSFSIASQLNECIAAGDWTLYYAIDEALKKVTPADVQRVANKYFVEDKSTTGWFIPILPKGQQMDGALDAEDTVSSVARAPHMEGYDGPYFYRHPADTDEAPAGMGGSLGGPVQLDTAATNGGSTVTTSHIADNAVRTQVDDIDLIAVHTGVKDVVTLVGAMPAGDNTAPADNAAIPTLAGAMLDKGTTQHDKFALAAELEKVGASIGFGVSQNSLDISAKCLRKDLPLVVSLLAEQLREPAFSPEEFEKVKKQLVGSLQRSLESVDGQAADAFTQKVYPPGHPNYSPSTAEMIEAVKKATLDEVKAYYKERYGPAHLTLVAVGDLDPTQLQGEVKTSFAGWTGGLPGPAAPAVPASISPDAKKVDTVFMADKPSVSILLGEPTGLRYTDPDSLALRVGTAILGQGFTGRLMGTVRDKEGLTYGIGSFVSGDSYADGDWKISATFAPQLLDKGIDSTRRELKKWYDDGVTSDELEKRKDNLVGTFKVGLATTDGLAGTILLTVKRGLDLNWLDQYPDKVQALTTGQVNTAIKKHLDPDNMILIQAGTVPTQ